MQPSRNFTKSRFAVATLLGCALLTGFAAAQVSDPGDDSSPPPAAAFGQNARMVRGTVTGVAGDRITLKTEAGDTFQVALTPNTRVVRNREPVKASDVKVGDVVGAMGEMDQANKTVHALFVSLVDAEQVRKMKESLGKTWIAGKVTAIDDLKLTILRSDKVTQVIAVDEDTSFKRGGRGMSLAMQGDGSTAMGGGFRRGSGDRTARPAENDAGESITLADIKLGDNVAGQGSLKNGIFVPTTLAVSDPAQRRRRTQPADGSGTSGPAATPPTPPAAPR